MKRKILILSVLLAGCSGMEQSERDKLREHNAQGEFIYRRHDEYLYPLPNPSHRIRDKYPWEQDRDSELPRITKEYFRCKGSNLNPPLEANGTTYLDCG